MPALQELGPGDRQKLGESCQAHLGGRCSGREVAKPRVSGRSQNGGRFPQLPTCHCISHLAVSIRVAECHPTAVGLRGTVLMPRVPGGQLSWWTEVAQDWGDSGTGLPSDAKVPCNPPRPRASKAVNDGQSRLRPPSQAASRFVLLSLSIPPPHFG